MISGLLLLPYPINMFLLAISSRNWNDPPIEDYYEESELPFVTIQLPVYNESNVIERTLFHLSKLVYPKDKLHIQILDDSTDQTSSIIDSEVLSFKKEGFNIEVIRRSSREGYKAGALSNGLKQVVSELVAIFDADFLINPNFLERTVHYFKNNEHIGAVQARWGHYNLEFSLFTRSMSIGHDGHFLVEKIGRKKRNAFISFNGSGGIWRKSTIEKSGGWSSATVAEDLDLAYRAQMKGYEIVYLRDLLNHQEIPPTLRYWIIQQKRWAKGFSQNLRKNLILFWQNPNETSRIQGSIHLTQYFVPLMIFLNAISSSMLLYLFFPQINKELYFIFGMLLTIATVCGIFSYLIAILRAERPLTFILLIPFFLFWGAGLIVRMGFGTIKGFFEKGGKFERTPKFNLIDSQKIKKIKVREKIPLDKFLLVELVYMLILCFGTIKGLELGGIFILQALFYFFLIMSVLNLVLSELRHAFTSH